MKHLKANTLQQLLERFRREAEHILIWGNVFLKPLVCLFIIVETAMNHRKYASVLRGPCLPPLCALFFLRRGIYQQDIAECHTTDSVRAWFKEHQDQFIVLPCPENSPHLSRINNLWNPLDR
ncbi:hypothetical protein TNCV_2540611 [Trichonephila clavipes]|nr:hypothetical protein TNCV_2540611 [Trichonephila clavipes]